MSSNSSGGTTPKWVTYLGAAASIATVLAAVIAYLAYARPNTPPSPTPTSPLSITTPTPTPTDTPIPTDTPLPTRGVAQSPYGSTPTQTMDAFCIDLYNHDYPAAYTLLSTSAQTSYGTESSFATRYYSARCGQNFGASPHGTYQQFPVYIIYPTRTYLCTYYLFQDSNSGWEIYSVYCQ
jgi:hypothetical protein